MRIPFIKNKKTSLHALTIGEEASTDKDIASQSNHLGIELIGREECSAVAGGPQISNRPDYASPLPPAPVG